ncbi:MAG: AMP-binding protein [Desulfobacula sp.]|uniref:AMP-binding protein n=1 Tax=Desulfobacula sp. TaxID=2593537 RepID=UPI0025C35C34|nr:AMP-binding protein [Desulfobacula sp.]MCD4720866.1 AMP-binding protein [Desulfobacula sp.]
MVNNIIPLEEELSFSKFDLMSEKYPENTAVLYLGEHFTYKYLRNLSERFAGGLQELGVKKGDKVLLYIPNCIQWVVAYFGIQKAGAVLVPVSPIYTSHEIEYMINNSGAETIICMDTIFGYVKRPLPLPALNEPL